jgi:hypothetical protein
MGKWERTWPEAPACFCVKRDMGMWQVEHLSSMAPRSDGWSSVSRRTEACQYGSRAALAIIDGRQS